MCGAVRARLHSGPHARARNPTVAHALDYLGAIPLTVKARRVADDSPKLAPIRTAADAMRTANRKTALISAKRFSKNARKSDRL